MKITSVRAISSADLFRLNDAAHRECVLRQLRQPLLTAFDIYKSNVSYGILQESKEEHEVVALWYRRLLDLDPSAVTEVPPRVAAYRTEEVTQ